MADFSTVGEYLSVGADPEPAATANYDLVVLASVDHQHVGEKFPTDVFRCPISDKDETPTLDEIKRAQGAAEQIAYRIAPFSVPFEIWKKFSPKYPERPPPEGTKIEEPLAPKNVLVTCEEGENRSLWVAGMALVLAGEKKTGKDARAYLELIRGPRAFRNKHMAKLLDDYYPSAFSGLRVPSTRTGVREPSRGGFRVD